MPAIITFIDFKKAFDSLHRESLWRILECYGIPMKYILIMQDMYKDNQCAVRTGNELSEWFHIGTGVKQGCILSPLLFGIAIDFITKKCLKGQTGIPWSNGNQLEDLDFADDIALLSRNSADMQSKTDSLGTVAGKIGLQISYEKTKVLRSIKADNTEIQLDGKTVEEVDHFTYLGGCVERDGDIKREVSIRIAKAAAAFKSLNNVWSSKIVSLKTKLRLFNSNVLSVLTYAAESWKSSKATDRRIDSFENKCLRKIMSIKWDEFRTTEEVRELSGQTPVSKTIRKRRWKYIGHTCRREDTRITKQALRVEVNGKRKRGRPRETLRRTILREAHTMGMSNITDIVLAAQDREGWRSKVEALCDG